MAKQAGVKFEAHYHITTVDPPELIYFIREHYPDVIFDRPNKTMWELIVKNISPPSRIQRYCCKELKEGGGEGRIVITGVRWAESPRRRKQHKDVNIQETKKRFILMEDNDEARKTVENCVKAYRILVNPIVDWSDEEVWEYHKLLGIPHCKLYDEGFTRIGCIGCPMNTRRKEELERWPKFRAQYVRTFDRMVAERRRKGRWTDMDKRWTDGEAVMSWWMEEEQSEDGGLLAGDIDDDEGGVREGERDEGGGGMTLKPCPFCGGEGELRSHTSHINYTYIDITSIYVECRQCGARASVQKFEYEAIKAWNKRKEGK